ALAADRHGGHQDGEDQRKDLTHRSFLSREEKNSGLKHARGSTQRLVPGPVRDGAAGRVGIGGVPPPPGCVGLTAPPPPTAPPPSLAPPRGPVGAGDGLVVVLLSQPVREIMAPTARQRRSFFTGVPPCQE